MSLLEDQKRAAERAITAANEVKERNRLARAVARRGRKLNTAIVLERRRLFGLAWDTVKLKDHQRAALAEVMNALPEDQRGKNWDVVKDFLTVPVMTQADENADLGDYRPSRLDLKSDDLEAAE